MPSCSPLDVAIDQVGLVRLSRELQVTHQAVRKWSARRRMPRTEWTGETAYSQKIEALTDGAVTRAMLLAAWPLAEQAAA
jgi:hypothetical protein